MKDFLNFKMFITPVIIQILFWIGIFGCVIAGLVGIFTTSVIMGLVILILGPVFVRIYCELLILIFKINERLTSLDNKTPNINAPQE